MIRRAFNLAAVLSLLAAVLLAVAIVWGMIRPGEYVWARRGTFHQVSVSPDVLYTSWMGGWWHDPPETFARMSSVWMDPRRCFLPAAVLPAVWLAVWFWRWRKRQGPGFPVEVSKTVAIHRHAGR